MQLSKVSGIIITQRELDRLMTLQMLSRRSHCPKGCDCRRCRRTERFRLTRSIMQRLDAHSTVELGGYVPRIEVEIRDGREFRWISWEPDASSDSPECPRTPVELRLWCASRHEDRLSDRDADREMARVWAAELRFLEERPRPMA